MSNEVKTYKVVAKNKNEEYSTEYVQALSEQQAVDILFSEVRDEYEIVEVTVAGEGA